MLEQIKKFKPFLPLTDLQYFADGGDNPPTGEGGGNNPPSDNPQGQDQSQGQQEQKTFTQEELNNLIAKEKKAAQENFLKSVGFDDFKNAKDGLAKFKDWQDSQKTEAQKQADALEQASKDLESTKAEKETIAAQLAAVKAGADLEALEDLIVLAKTKVTDEVTIDEAIKQTLEKYPHFKAQQEQQQNKPSFSGGQHTPPAGNGTDDPFAAKLAKYQ